MTSRYPMCPSCFREGQGAELIDFSVTAVVALKDAMHAVEIVRPKEHNFPSKRTFDIAHSQWEIYFNQLGDILTHFKYIAEFVQQT